MYVATTWEVQYNKNIQPITGHLGCKMLQFQLVPEAMKQDTPGPAMFLYVCDMEMETC